MKRFLLLAVLIVAGCTTAVQRNAYSTIFSVEQTATTAVDGYFTLVIKGTISTNSVPMVSQKFNQLQSACSLAAAVSKAGTNALATANLTIELTDLLNTISTLEKQ